MSECYAKKVIHKGIEAVELCCGGYCAVVAPTMGSSVLRFRDNSRGMEIFRYSDDVPIEEIMNAPEIWGLPTLYLPNRHDNGVLRTSDAIYHLPVNEERFKNHLHGFMHKRAHKIKAMGAENGKAFITTVFKYDENDYFFNCFPIKFTAEITIEVSDEGLRHTITLTNNSKVRMPISVATHTTINAPFVDGAKQEDIRLQVPCEKKLVFNKRRWLPNGKTANLKEWDMEYKNGTMCPVLKDICNDMYIGGTVKLNGEDFHGCVMTDTASGKKICYEVDDNYKFWIVWNHEGFKNYFCPEPMTAQVNAANLDMPAEKSGYCELKPHQKYTASQRFFTTD